MLPRRYIEEWKEFAPWPEDAQVEQDLVIEKAIRAERIAPAVASRVATRLRIGAERLNDELASPVQAFVPEVNSFKFRSNSFAHHFAP